MIRTGKETKMRVWSVTDRGNWVTARVSTSNKTKSGEMIYSNWSVKFVGQDTVALAKTLKKDSRISVQPNDMTIECTYAKSDTEQQGREYVNVTIFKFSILDDELPF